MYELKKRFKICAAHRLDNPNVSQRVNNRLYGKCNDMHGHNYNITLTLRHDDKLNQSGMIMNFDDLKDIFKRYIDNVYDHKILNDCPGFKHRVVTAENMAFVFYMALKEHIKELYAVEVEETEGASAIYSEG